MLEKSRLAQKGNYNKSYLPLTKLLEWINKLFVKIQVLVEV